MKKQYYITTPLYYVNAAPHIGHSYTQIASDAIARFLRQNEHDVFFMTGTDEHGEKIEKASIESGRPKGSEKDFVDSIIPRFKDLWKKLNIEYDYFIRTTDKLHEDTVKDVLAKLYKKGDVYKKNYNGLFCTPCEMFWPHTQAPSGLCPDCARPLEKLNEENYFFKMGSYQNNLIDIIEKDGIVIKPSMRKNEVLSFLKGNTLQDLCISRPRERLSWGIELPFDRNFVCYVWVDALINYISGAGYLNDKKRFQTLWPCDMHIIGKDILRHHAIYWPIMLIALGVKPPKSVFAHGWWVVGDEKMSKSKGNVVDPYYLLDQKGYNVDAFRYFLLSHVPFGWDGSFSEGLLVEKYNTDLANDLGNLLNRTLTMVEKYFAGEIPSVRHPATGNRQQEEKKLQEEIRDLADNLADKVKKAMDIEKEGPNFQLALNAIWELVNKANKYIEVSAPWKYAKESNKDALSVIMDTLMQTLGVITGLLYPFMPSTASKMYRQLGRKEDIAKVKYKEIRWGMIAPGTRVDKGQPLFPRINTE